MNLKDKIRSVMDYPKEGIDFKDITPVLSDPVAFKACIDQMSELAKSKEVDQVVGTEARGFIVGAPLALKLGTGFIPVRKPGKLPSETISHEYDLEYGTDTVEIHKDAIRRGQKVLIVDDLLATGGTALASAKLIEELGGEVVGMIFFIELEFLEARELLKDYDIESLVKF